MRRLSSLAAAVRHPCSLSTPAAPPPLRCHAPRGPALPLHQGGDNADAGAAEAQAGRRHAGSRAPGVQRPRPGWLLQGAGTQHGYGGALRRRAGARTRVHAALHGLCSCQRVHGSLLAQSTRYVRRRPASAVPRACSFLLAFHAARSTRPFNTFSTNPSSRARSSGRRPRQRAAAAAGGCRPAAPASRRRRRASRTRCARWTCSCCPRWPRLEPRWSHTRCWWSRTGCRCVRHAAARACVRIVHGMLVVKSRLQVCVERAHLCRQLNARAHSTHAHD